MINKEESSSASSNAENDMVVEHGEEAAPEVCSSNESDGARDGLSSDEQTDESQKEALRAMEAKADDHWQRYLRTAAEMENVRKRAVRDVENAHKFGLERFAADLLSVMDSLAMGLEAAKENNTVESLLEGSEMTLKLFNQVLSRHGITQIEPLGKPFDPELHEAMAMIDTPDAQPNTVVQVVQVGYQLNGRLLRAARVMVAKSAS